MTNEAIEGMGLYGAIRRLHLANLPLLPFSAQAGCVCFTDDVNCEDCVSDYITR